MRNSIYDLIFDGKRVNLQFLLSCRLVYNEAASIAVGSVAINLSCLQDPGVIDTRRLRELPISWRNACTRARFQGSAYANQHSCIPLDKPELVFQKAYTVGIFPVHTVIRLPWSSIWFHDRMSRLASLEDPSPALAQRYIGFGAFLDNPRLRSWRIVIPRSLNGVLAQRLDDEDRVMREPAVKKLPYSISTRLQEKKWLRGLRVTVVKKDPAGDFVVLIRHEEMPGVEAKVRFQATW